MDPDPTSIGSAASIVAATGGVVVGSGKALGWAGKRLLGPLFDEVGKDVKERYSTYRSNNLHRMAENAAAKGSSALGAGYEPSPRVVSRIVEDGSWAEGPLMAEYFGGIWAASLSQGGHDDRGLVWAHLVARLAASDVHLHFQIYDAFRSLFVGSNLQLGHSNVLAECSLCLPIAMDRVELEMPSEGQEKSDKVVAYVSGKGTWFSNPLSDVPAAALSLQRHGLIGENWTLGDRDYLRRIYNIDGPLRGPSRDAIPFRH